jgi:hypothetical protein
MSTFINPLTEFSPQMETSEVSSAMEFDQQIGHVFTASQELELASRLLGVTTEHEFEKFLGDLIKQGGLALGKFVNTPLGRSITDVLKTAATKALPAASTGNSVGGSLGAKLGTGLAAVAGDMLGLELEGLSPEDGELEASRQFIKFAGETVKNALEAPRSQAPATVAKAASVEGARVYAPGLINISQPGNQSGEATPRTGRWLRSHNTITLIGI